MLKPTSNMVNENGEGMTKEEEEEEEREAQELREWNAKNGTGSDGTGGLKSKEEWLKASKERREAQEALEGPINTHTNLDVCFLCAKPATSICEVFFDAVKIEVIVKTRRFVDWWASVVPSMLTCTGLNNSASLSWSR